MKAFILLFFSYLICSSVAQVHELQATLQQPVGTIGLEPLGNNAQYGFSVAISENNEYVFVSAITTRESPTISGSGSIFIYKNNAGEWHLHQRLFSTGFGDHFGSTSIVPYKLNGKQYVAISLIGTPANDTVSLNDNDFSGSVRIYRLETNGYWELFQVLDENTPGVVINGRGDEFDEASVFGISIAYEPSKKLLFVGAPGTNKTVDEETLKGVGRVFVFNFNGEWVYETVIECPSACIEFGFFGAKVAASGNWLFISNAHVFAQSPRTDLKKVWVFEYKNNEWQHRQTLNGFQTQEIVDRMQHNDYFGASIVTDGNWLAVSAPAEATLWQRAIGAVYIYKRQAQTWSFVQRITTDEPTTQGFTSMYSMHLHNNNLYIPDIGRSTHGMRHGGVLVYKRQGNAWYLDEVLSDETTDYTYSGFSVYATNSHVVVGSNSIIDVLFPAFGPCADPKDIGFVATASVSYNNVTEECEATSSLNFCSQRLPFVLPAESFGTGRVYIYSH
jgi:hypothetical protein